MTSLSCNLDISKMKKKYPSNGWRNQPTSLYYCSHLGSHLAEKLFIIAAYLIICANIGGVWYLPNFISQIWWCIILRPLKPLCKTLSVLLAFEPFMVPYYFYLLYNVRAYLICLLFSYGKDSTRPELSRKLWTQSDFFLTISAWF